MRDNEKEMKSGLSFDEGRHRGSLEFNRKTCLIAGPFFREEVLLTGRLIFRRILHRNLTKNLSILIRS